MPFGCHSNLASFYKRAPCKETGNAGTISLAVRSGYPSRVRSLVVDQKTGGLSAVKGYEDYGD